MHNTNFQTYGYKDENACTYIVWTRPKVGLWTDGYSVQITWYNLLFIVSSMCLVFDVIV